jgi:hypothetical protein
MAIFAPLAGASGDADAIGFAGRDDSGTGISDHPLLDKRLAPWQR